MAGSTPTDGTPAEGTRPDGTRPDGIGQLAVAVAVRPGLVVLTLDGELDLATGDLLAGAIDPAAHRDAEVVIDLKDLRFVDVVGLRALEALALEVTASGGTVVLQDPSPATVRLLDLREMWLSTDCWEVRRS